VLHCGLAEKLCVETSKDRGHLSLRH